MADDEFANATEEASTELILGKVQKIYYGGVVVGLQPTGATVNRCVNTIRRRSLFLLLSTH